MVYLCFDPDTLFFNRKTKGFDVQEKLVYQIIEEAGNKGDWIFLVIIYFVNYCLHHFLFLHQACWSYQYVGCMSYMNLVYCMTKSWVLRSSVVGASDQCLEGLRFIPVEESDFSLSCALDMLITSFLKNINMLF